MKQEQDGSMGWFKTSNAMLVRKHPARICFKACKARSSTCRCIFKSPRRLVSPYVYVHMSYPSGEPTVESSADGMKPSFCAMQLFVWAGIRQQKVTCNSHPLSPSQAAILAAGYSMNLLRMHTACTQVSCTYTMATSPEGKCSS